MKRFRVPSLRKGQLRPLLMVPGYCMNTNVLSYHPEGMSMVEFLAYQGFDVWTANLRGQGPSRCIGGVRNFGFAEMALEDLPRVIDVVMENSGDHDRVDLLGCSLGGTLVFSYLAHHLSDHRAGSIICIGAPLRWDRLHPLVRFAFQSPKLAGALPIKGTRRLARAVLPVARRVPKLLDMYMNTSIIDFSNTRRLVQTVDDPIRKLNFEIATWMKAGDLTVNGVNVTQALADIDRPLLCIYANADGIVPPESASSAARAFGAADVQELFVGDDSTWFAHADMFISRHAQAAVFEPLAHWLAERNS